MIFGNADFAISINATVRKGSTWNVIVGECNYLIQNATIGNPKQSQEILVNVADGWSRVLATIGCRTFPSGVEGPKDEVWRQLCEDNDFGELFDDRRSVFSNNPELVYFVNSHYFIARDSTPSFDGCDVALIEDDHMVRVFAATHWNPSSLRDPLDVYMSAADAYAILKAAQDYIRDLDATHNPPESLPEEPRRQRRGEPHENRHARTRSRPPPSPRA